MKTDYGIKTTLMALIFGISAATFAQEDLGIPAQQNSNSYKNAFGVRAGETSGFTYKHFINNNNAIEGILSFWPHTAGLTGLYERHKAVGSHGVNLYYGGGGHINGGGGRYRSYYIYRDNYYYDYVYVRRYNELALGVDGILGLEYKFRPIPLAISADIKPYFEVSNFNYSYFTLDPSIGIKLAF